MTDAQIASAMQQYGVTPTQMASATNLPVSDVQSRFDTAVRQNLNEQITSRVSDLLSKGGNEFDIAREANKAGLSARDLSIALNIPEQEITRLSGGVLNGTPARPTFSGVAADWNLTHLAKYGTLLNLARTSSEAVENQTAELRAETKRRQDEWDAIYGNTPEGKIIKENPPPDWRQFYEPWSQNHVDRFGRIIDRPWSTDEATINEKRNLDQQYVNAVNEYNQKYGTNLAPDPSVLGTFSQPSEFSKDQDRKRWYENPLNVAAALALLYFGGSYLSSLSTGGGAAAGAGAAGAGAAGGVAGGTGLTAGAGGATGLLSSAGGVTGLVAPSGFALAPEIGAGLLAAGGASSMGLPSTSPVSAGGPVSVTNIPPSSVTPPTVPSAFETAINTSLGTTPQIGGFGPAGTAGFGTTLPAAGQVAAGLEAAGFAPGTAANLAGTTAAGTGATNLLGGATAAAPLTVSPGISPTEALRAANMLRQVAAPDQPERPPEQQAAQMAAGAVDYSGLLNLLSSQARTSGLLGTQFRPQPINLASLLG